MNEVRRIWERLSVLGRDVEKQVYTRLGTERRLFIIKDREGKTLLSTPLLLAALVGLLLLVWVAPLLVIAVVGALLFKCEFVIVKETPKEPR